MFVDVTVRHLSNLKDILLSFVFIVLYFSSVCLWFAKTFFGHVFQCTSTFLKVLLILYHFQWLLCFLQSYFVSFTHGCFLQFQSSLLASMRQINFIVFSFDYIMLFQTHYSNLVHSFSCLDLCIFLIVTFVSCVIVERR